MIFTFVNLSKNIRLFHEGLKPVVRSKSKPNWIRLHEDQVFYYRSQYHSDRFVLSIAFKFSTYDDNYQFALTYPYTYTHLNNFINLWTVELKRNNKTKLNYFVKKNKFVIPGYKHRKSPELYMTEYNKVLKNNNNQDEQLRTRSSLETRSLINKKFLNINVPTCSSPSSSSDITRINHIKSIAKKVDSSSYLYDDGSKFNFNVEILCTSLLSKNVYKLSIKNCYQISFIDYKPKVIILCRCCGNIDSSAFFVCQGILDFILSDHKIAKVARKYLNLDIYPMLNPDSIYVGNCMSDLMGQTKVPIEAIIGNEKNQYLYENLYLFYKNLIKELKTSKKRIVILELSVNFNIIGSRILGSYHENNLQMERHLSFPRLLSRFASDFYLEYCEFSKKKSSCSPIYFDHNIYNR